MPKLKLFPAQRERLEQISKKYDLRLIVIYGSQVKGIAKPKSDLDIGILGKKKFEFDDLLRLSEDLEEVFPKKDWGELDVKSLHRIDPLFRWQVMRDSSLIYGNQFDYNSFRIYAWRAFQDSQSLFRLEEAMAKKGLGLLKP